MNCGSGLGFLREIERKYEKERKIKIDVSKTEYPLIRNVASSDTGWTIWGKEGTKLLTQTRKGTLIYFGSTPTSPRKQLSGSTPTSASTISLALRSSARRPASPKT